MLIAHSLVATALWASLPALPNDAPFALEPGDTIAVLGNRLAEGLQHDGSFEARLQARFPELGLSVRHLGFSGDQLDAHQRTANFGKFSSDPLELDLPEEPYLIWDRYLEHVDADVVLACFGFGESFAGVDGLDAFRDEVRRFIEHFADYRLVLVGPPPVEDLGARSLPAPGPRNGLLALYGRALGEVAVEQGVRFVDTFEALVLAYANDAEPLTFDGVHFAPRGQRVFASVLEAALFERASDAPEAALLDAVRAKNALWHRRYQAFDGYNLYGDRSRLAYTEDGRAGRVTNFEILQAEMDRLDALVAAGDRRIHALARGEAPPPAPEPPVVRAVRTNRPGPLPGGAYAFLGGKEALDAMTTAPGLAVNLFADESLFPELVNPVQMAWDPRGRLFVLVWPSYPHAPAETQAFDKLLVLEDLDGDGRADACTTFADGLHNPTGLEHWNGGVFVGTAPELLWLADTDGDGRADVRERVLTGFSSADTHHAINSFVLGPDGALYFQEGTFHRSQIETIHGVVRNRDGCVWRYDPRTRRLERYLPLDFANPHGHVFDRYGQDFVTDGTGNVNYFALPATGRLNGVAKKRPYFPFFQQRSRPAGATEILSSRHFPPAQQGNYLIANVIGFQGIFQYEVRDDGSGFRAEEVAPIVSSTDENFRPVDLEIGPDGALYFLDWHNPLIGHMQHHLRDPARDAAHGRVYRVTHPGRPLVAARDLAQLGTEELVAVLASPDDRERYRARCALSARPYSPEHAARFLERFESAPEAVRRALEHEALELLWLAQQHDVVEPRLLEHVLTAESPEVRAAGVRVVRQMRHRLPDALRRLLVAARDPAPRVRLEALVGASFFDDPDALLVALQVRDQPFDRFLEYAFDETLRVLEPFGLELLRSGELTPGQRRFLAARVTDAELAALPRDEHVLRAIVERGSATRAERAAAAEEWTRLGAGRELADLVVPLLLSGAIASDAVLDDLGALLLDPVRATRASAFERLAADGATPRVRALGVAGLATTFAALAPWFERASTPEDLEVLLAALPLIPRDEVRREAWGRARALSLAVDAPLALLETLAGAGELGSAAARCAPRLVESLEALSDLERTTDDAARRAKLARSIAANLALDARRDLLARLDLIEGTTLTIGALPHRMLFDVDEFYVEAERAVALTFENADSMPHNLVIVRPGALADIGAAAEALGSAGEAQGYVPDDERVLCHTGLVRPGESERLVFRAPSEPGAYPYVCTYPGHWRVMQGTLHVVAQLDAAQRRVRRAERDDVAARRFVRDWTLDELAPRFREGWRQERWLERGAALFDAAGCLTCHCQSKGIFAGPDLGELRPELRGLELLRHVLEPSLEIDPAYRYHGFELANGKRATGRVLQESDDEFVLIEVNGTAACRVPKAEVAERWMLDLSPMPTGMLVTLEADEILDLVHYVEAQGQPDEPPRWLALEPGRGPGAGLHVVCLAGDEEYRSEESLPMLARLLAERFGFRATVLFATDADTGAIDPTEPTNVPGMHILETADLVVVAWRFREPTDVDMARFDRYLAAGKPLIGLRTATHAFAFEANPESPFAHYDWRSTRTGWSGGFGGRFLGETWVAHHGEHGRQSTRGVHASADHPILRGVGEPWGPSDVYAVGELPADATVLLRGLVLDGMQPGSSPVAERNAPAQPLVWTRERATAAGTQRVVTSTLGASQDFEDEHLRRLFVNACLWCVGREDAIDAGANVAPVRPYRPTAFGFGTHARGLFAADR